MSPHSAGIHLLFFVSSLSLCACLSLPPTQLNKRNSISDMRPGSRGGLAGLFGKKKSGGLASLFGDAMNANALSKLKGSHSGGGSKKKGKKGKRNNAKDKRFHIKQSQKRHKEANAAPSSDRRAKNKLGGLVLGNNQKSKKTKVPEHEFKLPGAHQVRGEKLQTRQEFAGDDEWTKMMDEEKQKMKATKRKK